MTARAHGLMRRAGAKAGPRILLSGSDSSEQRREAVLVTWMCALVFLLGCLCLSKAECQHVQNGVLCSTKRQLHARHFWQLPTQPWPGVEPVQGA